jgi:tetratricopeptide (TPR) repeat protein
VSGVRAVGQARELLAAGRHAAALETISSWLASNPDDRDALIVAADALNGLERYDEAQRAAYRVLASEPSDLQGLLVAVDAAIGRGDRTNAIALADEAVRSHPTSWVAHAAVARVGIAGASTEGRVLRSAQEAVRLAPGAAGAHLVLGEVWRRRGELLEARSEFRIALTIDPLDADAANNLAVLMVQRRRASAAIRVFGDILRREPLYELARINLLPCVKMAISNFAIVSGATFVLMWILGFSAELSGTPSSGLSPLIAAVGVAVLATLLALFLIASGPRVRRYLRGPGRPPPVVLAAGLVAIVVLPVGLVLALALPDASPRLWQAGFAVSVLAPSIMLRIDNRRIARQGSRA